MPDVPGFDGPIDCSEVGGFRRCDERCPMLCPDRIRCPILIPLCIPNSVSAPDGACGYVEADPTTGIPDMGLDIGLGDIGCEANGLRCALPGAYPVESGTPGDCIPLDVCLADRPVGFPEFHCVWSDMTPVTGPPPVATCPADVNDATPFCGGSCERINCPVVDCIGVSNARGFGICTTFGLPITGLTGPGAFAPSARRMAIEQCTSAADAPCAFLVPLPQPSSLPFGWVVAADACRVYRDIYPANAECRDVNWVSIP
jgi:hypothetical protein